MTIDGRSLLAVVAALCVVFSIVVLALERRIRQPMPGLRLWAVANLFLGAAAAAHMLQGHVPTWVPAVPSQPPAVTWFGWQRKNLTLPPGTGSPTVPVTVAVSVTDVPR